MSGDLMELVEQVLQTQKVCSFPSDVFRCILWLERLATRWSVVQAGGSGVDNSTAVGHSSALTERLVSETVGCGEDCLRKFTGCLWRRFCTDCNGWLWRRLLTKVQSSHKTGPPSWTLFGMLIAIENGYLLTRFLGIRDTAHLALASSKFEVSVLGGALRTIGFSTELSRIQAHAGLSEKVHTVAAEVRALILGGFTCYNTLRMSRWPPVIYSTYGRNYTDGCCDQQSRWFYCESGSGSVGLGLAYFRELKSTVRARGGYQESQFEPCWMCPLKLDFDCEHELERQLDDICGRFTGLAAVLRTAILEKQSILLIDTVTMI